MSNKEKPEEQNLEGESLTNLENILANQEATRKSYLQRFGPPVVLPELSEATKQKIAELFGELDPLPKSSEQTMTEYFSRPIHEELLTDEDLDKDLADGHYNVPITLRAYPWLKTLVGRRLK